MERQSAVYLLASDRSGTLYIGVTSNLMTRFGSIANTPSRASLPSANVTNLV